MEMKACTTCWGEYPLSGFHKKVTAVDGRSNECKGCKGERQREYYKNNRPALLAKQKEKKLQRKRKSAAAINKAERAANMRREDERLRVRDLGDVNQDYFKGMGLAEIAENKLVTSKDWREVGAIYSHERGFGGQG